MNTIDSHKSEQIFNGIQIGSVISTFFQDIKLGVVLKSCGFYKQVGVPVMTVFHTIFSLTFSHMNWWRTFTDKKNEIKKDVVYRFLNNPRYQWERLLLKLSTTMIKIINAFNHNEIKVLVFDDTFVDRMRSKVVELLSWIYDHVDRKNKKGFLNLTGGWTDGNTFIPYIFQLVCSVKNILRNSNPEINNKIAIERRQKAKKKKTELLIEMVQTAITEGIPFSFVLFDSWFSFPVIFVKLSKLKTNAIAMLKDHVNIFYTYRGKQYRLSVLYAKIKNHLKKDRDRYSVVVSISALNTTLDVRIVFVRDKRSKRNWVALLSTDITIDDETIIKTYGKRWDIEVFFKMDKTYLKFAKEFQGRSFDMLTAHTTIVYIRYMMIAYCTRLQMDEKNFGDLFYECCDELIGITFVQALARILNLLKQFLMKKLTLSECFLSELLDEFMQSISSVFFQNFGKKRCES